MARDGNHVEAPGAEQQRGSRRASPKRTPAAPFRLADDDARGAARLRVLDESGGGRRSIERHGLGAERLGEAQQIDTAIALHLRQSQQRWRLYIHDRPLGTHRIGEPLAGAHELLGLCVRTNRHEQVILREPLARAAVAGERRARRSLDSLRHTAQCKLAQRNEIRLAEEALYSRADLVRHVDLAGVEPREQIVGREIDELDLVSLVEDVIGQRLALFDARDLRDEVVQALEVLNVERRPDVDAGVE